MIEFLLRLFTPIQKLMQKLGRSEPKMNRGSVDLAMSLIKVGDILVTHEDQRLTSIFIKGEYDHAAILSPAGIIEAVGDDFEKGVNIGGVRSVDLQEFLFLMDKVAIIRPLKLGAEANYLAGVNAISYKGKGYDYEFKIDKDKIYCSELVYLSYKEFGIFNDLKHSKILPQHFRDLCDDVNFKLIFEFK